MGTTNKKDNAPIYSSQIVSTYIKFIKSNYSYIVINDLLSYAKMESYQIDDPGHWFTQQQINRFHEKLTALTGNKDVAREVGRYSASPDIIGGMKKYVLGFIGPDKAYVKLGRAASKFTKSSSFNTKSLGPNKIEFIVTPNEGVREEPFQCENRLGYIEAFSNVFNYKLPKIEHPECIFKGGASCRYIVSWKGSPVSLWKKIRNITSLLFASVFLVCFIFNRSLAFAFLPIFLGVPIFLSWYAGKMEIKALNAAVNSLRDSADELLEKSDQNYNNALMINEIGQALSKQTNIDAVLNRVIQILQKRLDFDRGMVLLANRERTKLFFRTGFGYSKKHLHFFNKTSFSLDKKESKGAFVISFKKQEPFLINDIDEIQRSLSTHSLQFAKTIGVKSFICCPIIFDKESLGILAVDNIKTKRPLLQSDLNLLMGIAPQIGISMHNAMLREAETEQFKSILHVLAASIDARDPLTAGHSEKVTEYAVGMCRGMGLPNDYCEMVRVASLLHDYGKIGVEDSILKKKGALEPDEYEKIKTHVIKTKTILSQIKFEGIYKQVPDVAGAHHEKIDGSGYPKGLRGDDIPLGAQIIAVADFFEAITSKRHYRDPMYLGTAFELMQKKSDIYFRKEVVEALITYYNREHQENPMHL
jgi:HD-GYP domain-containing protein (c-di-GMP phosphodiesterase class II)